MSDTVIRSCDPLLTTPSSLLAQVDQFSKLWDTMGGGGSKNKVMSQLKELTTALISKELVI